MTHTCPRRIENGMDREGPLVGSGPNLDNYDQERNGYHTCSYCGSVEPGEFMQAVRDGVEVGPTDKSYKVYVGNHDGKFNPVHMTPEQGDEFRRLYVAGRVNVGYPGHFYTPLYIPMTEQPAS